MAKYCHESLKGPICGGDWGGALGKHHGEGGIGLDIKDEEESSRQRDSWGKKTKEV